MLNFTAISLNELKRFAENCYPSECCGILIGRNNGAEETVTIAYPVRNMTAGDNCRSFCIDPLEILRSEIYAEQNNLEILGFFHSHPDNEASASTEDIRHMITGYFYPIISVRNGKAAEIRCYQRADNNAVFEVPFKRREINADNRLYCRNAARLCE